MTDPLGQSQVLPYLLGLSKKGHQITLLSFEKEEKYTIYKQEIEALLKNTSIVWYPLKYTKKPPVLSTMIDIRKGKQLIKKLHKKNHFDIVHCRGYISMLLGMALKKKGVKIIFDMRGWWPDEKLESGFWNKSYFIPVYKYFKKLEQKFFVESDFIVSLTHASKKEIIHQFNIPENKIGVIPTCVNFQVFKAFEVSIRNRIRNKYNIPIDSKVLLYSGSLGGNYDLSLFVKFFDAFNLAFPDSYFLILSNTNKKAIEEYFIENTPNYKNIIIDSSSYSNVHEYIMAGDVGLILYGEGFSNIGRSPTKLGEYWASGLPIISLPKIGDVDSILSKGGGVIAASKTIENIKKAFEEIDYHIDKNTLRKKAIDYYSLDKGILFYLNSYKKLLRTK